MSAGKEDMEWEWALFTFGKEEKEVEFGGGRGCYSQIG